MLNNNDKAFGEYKLNHFVGELNVFDFKIQYKEYLARERELDKFLIRAMYFNGIDITKLDVSVVSNMSDMFYNIRDFNEDISNWDVSNVTDMSGLFRNCAYFNQNINSWDVSNVIDMNYIFSGSIIFNQPLDKWDTSKVVDMAHMFFGCDKFNQDISNWDVSNVTDLSSSFSSAKSFNKPLNNWNVSNVSDISFCFCFATNFNQDINDWNVSNVTSMFNMFYSAESFQQYIGNWECNSCSEPTILGLSFGAHNHKYKFTKETLDNIMSKFKNNQSDENKYNLIKYSKQFREFDLDNFNLIMNELKTKSNSGKEFFDEIS